MIVFIVNDLILFRESGILNRLLKSGIKFKFFKFLEVEFNFFNKGKLVGMGIEKGIMLIVGGGYYGKFIVLKVFEFGVYNYI